MNAKQPDADKEDRKITQEAQRSPGVPAGKFGPNGEWELEVHALGSPDETLNQKDNVSARFTIQRSKIPEGVWTTAGEGGESFHGHIVYHMRDLETDDPRLFGIRLEIIYENSDRLSFWVPIDKIEGKTFYGKDDDGKIYKLLYVGETES